LDTQRQIVTAFNDYPFNEKTIMRIQPVVKKGLMKEIDEQQDLLYWLSKPPRKE
jgi:hypothetical protein